MSQLYDPDRLSKIGEIMPRFNQHVQEGDEIYLGLEGDPAFPSEFKENRPKGVVTKVKHSDDSGESTTIRVKMENGQSVDIAPHSIDPQRVWEFTDESFQEVLKRSIAESEPEVAAPEPEYRGGNDDIGALRAEISKMKAAYEQEFAETRNFNNTLIATLNEMASDVCAVSGEKAGFCSVFKNEYSKMMTNDGPEDKASPFDSDFSESSDDEF